MLGGSVDTRIVELLRSLVRNRQGLTLVELLVVLLIISLLAAIAVPSFAAQRERAADAEAKTIVRTARVAIETYHTDHQSYDGADNAALQNLEPALSSPRFAPGVVFAGGQDYEVTATSANGHTFTITKSGSTITRSCAPANAGGCNDGSW
jgi:type IV pilus assembly protein PilA